MVYTYHHIPPIKMVLADGANDLVLPTLAYFQMPPAKLNVICLNYTGEPGKNKATEHH
jgi:hypothetical protein